jgi:hypothetical protein
MVFQLEGLLCWTEITLFSGIEEFIRGEAEKLNRTSQLFQD